MGYEPVPMWDGNIAGSGFTCYTTGLALRTKSLTLLGVPSLVVGQELIILTVLGSFW